MCCTAPHSPHGCSAQVPDRQKARQCKVFFTYSAASAHRMCWNRCICPDLRLVAPCAREVLWSPSQLPIPPFDLSRQKFHSDHRKRPDHAVLPAGGACRRCIVDGVCAVPGGTSLSHGSTPTALGLPMVAHWLSCCRLPIAATAPATACATLVLL